MDCNQFCLCCTGSYPCAAWGISQVVGLGLALVANLSGSVRVLRIFGLLEIGSIITAPIGVYMLFKLRKVKKVNRGCDCCCPCPFPAWSLLFQIIDIVGVLMMMFMETAVTETAENDGPAEDATGFEIGFVILWVIAAILDITFGVFWLKELNIQDGNICCGTSKIEIEQGSPHVTVVGQPIALKQ